ncbi:hypothetical protein CJ198_06620 [Brevibacterium luteolum]|uniref:Uncharacterized protein n=1 Tax=Brevibacterium luteolum TaxID=199591 RepID=A0A2N6PH84_9MICO|nr:hypothetical protein CJ198_06620 [Brevibacterium luteolum]
MCPRLPGAMSRVLPGVPAPDARFRWLLHRLLYWLLAMGLLRRWLLAIRPLRLEGPAAVDAGIARRRRGHLGLGCRRCRWLPVGVLRRVAH